MVKFCPTFCYCAVDQENVVLEGNGPFLAHLLVPKWSNFARISAIVLQTKKRSFLKGNGPFLAFCRAWRRRLGPPLVATGGLEAIEGSWKPGGFWRPQALLEVLEASGVLEKAPAGFEGKRISAIVLQTKKVPFLAHVLLGAKMVKFCPTFCYCAVDQENVVLKGNGPFLAHLLVPEMVKFCPNFCYCAADQEKVVFKRKRAVSSLGEGPRGLQEAPALWRQTEGPAGNLLETRGPGGPWTELWRPLEA